MDALRRLTDEQREVLLALADERTVPDGAELIREGQPAAGLVLVLDGSVRIEKDHLGGRVPVDELGSGELLGDVSYLLGSGATASVVADGAVRVAVIATSALDRLVADHPALGRDLFRSIGEVLAERLDRRTGDVVGMAWSWG